MNWDAIGAVAEALGALGVIASLVYLATQLKSNALASTVEAKLTTIRFMTDFNRDLIMDPSLFELWNRGSKDLQDLSDDEFARFSNLNLSAFWFFSAAFYQFEVGKLTRGDLFEMEQIMGFWLSRSGVMEWWKKFGRTRFNPAFVDYIEANFMDQASPESK